MTHSQASDEELLSAAVSGSRSAFAAQFDRFAAPVGRYAWTFARSMDEVQELVQETFLTAWSKRADIRIVDSSILPWLLVTCRNHGRNLHRRRAKHAAVELHPEAVGSARGDDRDRARATLAVVNAEIQSLPPVDRRVAELCLLDGYSYREAAASVGATVGSVAKRLERVRIKLRKVVADHDA